MIRVKLDHPLGTWSVGLLKWRSLDGETMYSWVFETPDRSYSYELEHEEIQVLKQSMDRLMHRMRILLRQLFITEPPYRKEISREEWKEEYEPHIEWEIE